MNYHLKIEIVVGEDGGVGVNLTNPKDVKLLEIAGILGLVQQNLYDASYASIEGGKGDSSKDTK